MGYVLEALYRLKKLGFLELKYMKGQGNLSFKSFKRPCQLKYSEQTHRMAVTRRQDLLILQPINITGGNH